ncbi:MAG: MaoC family dehydratase N-terminal domain-containing protein [Deltaproteobacteria bacterium]|nr:MaoC family dehydratase N-terminal domain-containing protein [Deltaproteobacteria bacterium]MBW1934245.1 MaoC family dehydratase N-terminal domain-containing protein [Deltaproteobacteria bacterium]MBW1977848.1 MaoC family dehydratase N-terminal domain-containing protein [Deltaproteobacteria bacterium]MBW2044627.1 MaoC family dehydratase N-terminal domain-containing protein [Deltaproteobacteria bacterium]MBW2298990.1 MaoC family dehydratase N-terminal domain-containing protein [Deltaproteobac
MEHSKYGDDFNVGDVYTTGAITVTETHLVNWAGLTMDFYPLHVDKEYAAKSQFGQRLAHGPLIFALAVGLVSTKGFAGDAAIAWLGADNMKMLAPVYIGDTISVEVEVIDKQKTSKPDRGVQVWRYSVKNQKGEKVMVFDYKMMFHMRT